MRPKISVIVPVYQVEAYIDEALSSIRAQSLRDIEILCVDDQGQDGSMDAVRRHAGEDDRIRLLAHGQNRGLAIARNTGMAAARGECLFFLDSDDALLPGILEKLHAAIERTSSDVAACRYTAFLESPTPSRTQRRTARHLNAMNAGCPTEGPYEVSAGNLGEAIARMKICAWNKLYSADFLRGNGIAFPSEGKIIFEDVPFMLKQLACRPRVYLLDDIGVRYRIRPQSITNSVSRAERYRNHRAALADALQYIERRLAPPEAQRMRDAISRAFPKYMPRPWRQRFAFWVKRVFRALD